MGPRVLDPAGWLDKPAKGIGQGAGIFHTFTEEERTTILAQVLNGQTHTTGDGKEYFIFDGNAWSTKFRDQLVKLFSDPQDPAVYYFAD